VPDHTSRLRKVKALLRTCNCTHILITDIVDIAYLSGFHATSATLLISRRAHLLFSDFRYETMARQFCKKNPQWKFIPVAGNDYSFLGTHIPPRSRLGIQSNTVTIDQLKSIKKHLRKTPCVSLGGTVSTLFSSKSSAEIGACCRAANIAASSLHTVLRSLSPSMTEKDIATSIDIQCRKKGAQGSSFPTIVLSGTHSALPHGTPSSSKIRRGTFLLIDFGCIVDGCCSDMTRTVALGKATQKQRDIYRIVYTAQKKARRAARPGITAAEVDTIARSVIEDAGFGTCFGHATGHGVGRRIHEKPRISSNDTTVLQPDMIVTVEPGIYIPSLGGVRIEDMIRITSTGATVVTHFPRHLIEIPL
jgi:Xaa-Pro aminopeptidase